MLVLFICVKPYSNDLAMVEVDIIISGEWAGLCLLILTTPQ